MSKRSIWRTLVAWLIIPRNDDEGLNTQTRPHGYALKVTALTLGVFITWAWFADLDQVTRAPGSIIASSRSQLVQSVDGGIVETLVVKEGDIVRKNQLLAQLDRTKLQASFEESRAKAAALRMNVARLRAEVLDQPLNFGADGRAYPQFRMNQEALFNKRRVFFHQEIIALEGMYALAERELKMNEPLMKTGDVSEADIIKLQRQAADFRSQILNKRNKYFQDVQAELSRAEEEFAGVEQTLAQRKDQLERSELRAPVNGVVKNVRVTTIGGVLRPGEELLSIVPLDDTLLVEAKVRPADIGFIKTGLPASVKLDAYDYTVYGSLNGTVKYISPDTLKEESRQGEQEYYRVQIQVAGVELDGKSGKKIEISPGMTATAEIKTGSNTVLRYLTKPLVKTFSESLAER